MNTLETENLGTRISPLLYHFEDLMFTVRADSYEHYVEFNVYDILETDVNGEPGRYLYAKVLLHGSVKWDGCSNWWFDAGYVHGCRREDLERIGQVMSRCWDLTAELCPGWTPNYPPNTPEPAHGSQPVGSD